MYSVTFCLFYVCVKKTMKLALCSAVSGAMGVAQIKLTANLHVVQCVMLVEVSLSSNISVPEIPALTQIQG